MPSQDERPQLPIFFYRTQAGAEPVRIWLRTLPEADRRTIGTDPARPGRMAHWHAVMPIARR